MSNILYQIIKDWIGDDVQVSFTERHRAFTGRLAEVCDIGLFVMVEADEWFIPWTNVAYVKHIKETE